MLLLSPPHCPTAPTIFNNVEFNKIKKVTFPKKLKSVVVLILGLSIDTALSDSSPNVEVTCPNFRRYLDLKRNKNFWTTTIFYLETMFCHPFVVPLFLYIIMMDNYLAQLSAPSSLVWNANKQIMLVNLTGNKREQIKLFADLAGNSITTHI